MNNKQTKMERLARIASLLKRCGLLSITEIAERIGCSGATAKKAMRPLINLKQVDVTVIPTNQHGLKMYSLAEVSCNTQK